MKSRQNVHLVFIQEKQTVRCVYGTLQLFIMLKGNSLVDFLGYSSWQGLTCVLGYKTLLITFCVYRDDRCYYNF
jgi:hypothetical protein